MTPLHWMGLAALLASGAALPQTPPTMDPRGRWITASGNLEVAIAPCGAALCGTVTRVLGNRSVAPGAAPVVWRGEIYNRENGKTYRCTMRLSTAPQGAGELLLHAYVGLPLFGRTQAWQRVPAQVQAALRRHGIGHAVAQDNRYATWRAWRNQYWPSLCLVDRQGRVVFHHVGEGDDAHIERQIEQALR